MQNMAHLICLVKLYLETMRKKFDFFVSDYLKPRSILKQFCMWLVDVVNANKQLSVSKQFCFKYRISMIKAELSFV